MARYPVVLFCYKRLDHLTRTVEALARNHDASETDLFVVSDAAKSETDKADVDAVREYLKSIDGFKSVSLTLHPQNRGLKASIVDGVTRTCDSFGAAIVLEDDIETSPEFLRYMNACLNTYANDKKVIGVSGFSYITRESAGTYFVTQPLCWGWATWKDRWDGYSSSLSDEYELSRRGRKRFNYNGGFNFYQQYSLNKSGKLNTWYIFWYLRAFVSGSVTVYPDKSLCRNLGFDGTGTNSSKNIDYNTPLYEGEIAVEHRPPRPDQDAYTQICRRLQTLKPGIRRRLYNRLRRIL